MTSDILKTIQKAHAFELQNAKAIESPMQRRDMLILINDKFERLLKQPANCLESTITEIKTERNHERFIFLSRFSGYASFYNLSRDNL